MGEVDEARGDCGAALAAWGPHLARADEASPAEPSVTVIEPAPAVPPPAAPPASAPAAGTPAEPPREDVPAASPALAPLPQAFSQDPPGSPPSAVAPPARPGPPPEGRLAVSQIFLGSLATFFAGGLVTLAAVGARSAPLAYVGFGATPAVGALVVCGLGRDSQQYEGRCAPSILGGYLGAIALAIPMWYLGSVASGSRVDPAGGETSPDVGALLGAAVGGLVGAAVGATIAWHVSKRRRARPARVVSGAPLAPPAALTAWTEVGARPAETRGPTTVGVPLLSLRF